MNRLLTSVIIALALVPVGASAQSRCSGGNPAINHVEVQSTHTMGQVNVYVIVGSVTNMGTMNQPSNTLQFVDIYDGTEKVDSKSISPITTSGTTHFTYNWKRATDAGTGTTTLTFKLRMVNGTNCNPANGATATLRF